MLSETVTDEYHTNASITITSNWLTSLFAGVVTMTERVDSAPVELSLLRVPVDQVPAARPNIMPAAGMSAERQHALYTRIRPFVREDCQDITCPRPPDSA